MSLLSLDSSFQNPSQNRHGSLANITSSIHSSPKSNRNTLKPNSSSKSIEKPPNNRNNSSTKKAPLAKTPQKYTNRDNFSPLPLSKRSIPRNDANPDFKRSYDPSTNRAAAPPRDPTLKRSSSKPLANISMCSSRVSSNLTHSDLRQSTFDKLNESIEALAKSALAESLYHAKEMPPRGSQSSSRKPAPTKSREPEVSSFSASGSKNQTLNMSGSKRNIMNSQNTSFVMQKVYSVNNKALNLTNLLTRPRSREDLSSRHPVLTSASRKEVKENDPKFTPIRQSLDHSSSSSSKLNMQKRLSEPAVKSKGLEVRNLNTSNIQETPYIPSSLVKSLIGGHNTSTNLGDITKITEKDESSHFCIGDKTVSFGDCNQTLSHYIKTEEKDDTDHELALNALKERFDVFVGTISTVFDEAAFREKRSFFIKLLTIVHAHKVKLSKFLASQEQNKKAFYFGLWNQALGQQSQHDFTQTSMICEKEAGIDQMLEEAQLSTAISFHSNKLLKKYFYQGFLGHYVVCKLGPEEQELLPEPIIKQDNNKRSKSPSMRPSPTTPQDKRNSLPTTNQRSKTPTNSQSLNIANFNLKPTSTRKYTPTDRSFRSQTCLTSPNQSFIKGTKYPPKGSKGTKEIMSASVLDQSFGCENPKTLLTEELIPDQILTKIPQPQKKEGLETLRFDTPRRMNTRNNTLESTERSLKSLTTTTGSHVKSKIPTQNRFGNSPSCQQQQSQKKKPQEKIPEKKEFTKVLKKKYEPSSRRETETTPPPLRQKPRSNSSLKRTEEKSVSSFTKTKGTRASYEEDDFFEVSEYNEQKALAFRKRKLTQLYGQKFLTILVTTTNRKIQAAWFLRIRNLLRKGLLGLLEAVECQNTQKSIEEIKEEEHSEDNSEEEDEEEESENMKMMMNIAKEHYETNVKINVFNNFLEYFVQSHEEGNIYAQYRDNSLKRSCFSKWFEVLPKLKEEDEKFELAYEAIVQKFHFIMLTEKALRQWRNYIAEGGKDQSDE